MSEFYAIDSTRVSLREYWWGTKSPLVIFGWMLKGLRIPVPSSSDDPNVDSVTPFMVEALPPDISNKFAALNSQLESLGFLDPIYQVIHDPGTRATTYWSTYRHSSGRHFARIHNRIWQQAQKADRGLFPMFFTEFSDGTFLVSSAGKPDMAAPSAVQMLRMPGAEVGALWAAHGKAADQAAQKLSIRNINDRVELVEAVERHHVLMRNFHLARGVFRHRTLAESSQAEAFRSRASEVQEAGLENPEVIVELERLQEQKPSWRSGLWILAASFVGFVAAGAMRWDWKFMLWIIPILLFHECGHWVAMKLFHYRNLRLFFIPLFGAAVTGRNWNVAGWKKALVSLAGPLPGIALGVVLGLLGVVLQRPQLTHGALLLLFINGFNLIPILPLDGGHVLQDVLFSRNRWLDTIFRVITIGGLLLLGMFAGMKMLMYIAIPLALAIPTVFKLSKVTDELRRQSLPEPAPAEDRIPQQTAQVIIRAVRAAFPPKVQMGNRVMAQHTITVFERINARPPGILATMALLLLHGGALGVSLLVGFLLVFAQSGTSLSAAASRQLQHSVKPGDVEQWPARTEAQEPDSQRTLLVTTLKNRSQAAAAFNHFTNQLTADLQLTRFGDSLLVSLPSTNDAQREHWFDLLQAQSTNVFVAVSNAPVTASLSFLVSDPAARTNLEQELEQYFAHVFNMHLIAPWSPAAANPQFEEFRRCRRDWMRINEVQGRAASDPLLVDYEKKISEAARRGSLADQERLEAELSTQSRLLRTKAVDRLRSDPLAPVSAELVDLNLRLTEGLTNAAERKVLLAKIAARLGEVQCPPRDRYGVQNGFVTRQGLLFQLPSITFYDPAVGLPALVDWLQKYHAHSIKYSFHGASWLRDLDLAEE